MITATHQLSRVKALLEPLAIASNITQASHTRLDHVLLTLANLFRIYSKAEIDGPSCAKIIRSIEKRWAKADQDVFIAATFLNPYIRKRCFNPAVLTESSLYNLIERVFERLFEKKGDLALLRAFTDYAKGVSEFLDEEMNLNQMTAMHLQEVSPTIRVWEFQTTDSTLKKKPLDLVFIWKRIDTQADNELPAGRNALTRLAIRLLSVVANSAGCERSFSIFGNIHTKTRNKLGTETVHKTGILKMDIRRRHVEEG